MVAEGMMPSRLQKVMAQKELRTAIGLLKCGLREMNRLDDANDFYHLPLLLLASGFERLMKTVICCHRLQTTGKFPDRSAFPKGKKGHDLVELLKIITGECFSDAYLAQVPAARNDIKFLRSDIQLRTIVKILSDFGQGGRYSALDVVIGTSSHCPSPGDEWEELEMAIVQEDPEWANEIADSAQSNALSHQVGANLTVHCERLARSLCRLFTIGGLGDFAKQASPHAFHFLLLMDDDLGKTDCEAVRI